MKVILTRGLMASGKSTWAKEFIRNNPSYKRISRDDFRHMTNFYDFEQKGSEELVTNLVYTALEQCIKEGYDIILDETNLNEKTMKKNMDKIIDLGCKYQKNVVFEIKDFEVSLQEAIIRDQYRSFSVGADVIKRAWKRYILPKKQTELKDKILSSLKAFIDEESMPVLHRKRSAIIVDIDGTLAINDGSRSYYDYDENVKKDKVCLTVAEIMGAMREYNKVLLVSGREGNNACRVATLEWLSENGVEYDELFMRKEGDNRSDVIVKTEIYEEHIKGKYNVLFVLDDRPRIVKMWCDLGIYTLNCNQDPYCVVEF